MCGRKPYGPGPVVLLGGEGLQQESDLLWRQMTMGTFGDGHFAILPTALATQKLGVAERRAKLALATLEDLGISAKIVSLTTHDDSNNPDIVKALQCASGIHLVGGEPSTLVEVLRGSYAWKAILARNRAGAMLTAAGGAASALGELVFMPLKPHPQDLRDLDAALIPGLGLLPGIVILPYFDWLQPQLVCKISSLCCNTLTIIGLGVHAALARNDQGWQVRGLGRVTILRHNKDVHVIDAGANVACEILPLL